MTSQTSAKPHLLTQLAGRFKTNPDYLASVLSTYQRQERLSDDALARRLSITVEDLPRLALCKRPVSQGVAFRTAVQQIAHYSGANELALLIMLRQVEIVGNFQALPAPVAENTTRQLAGVLAAARDHEDMPDTSLAEEVDSSEGPKHEAQ